MPDELRHRSQWAIVAAAALLGSGILLVFRPGVVLSADEPAGTPGQAARADPTAFRPTKEEWATLKTETVANRVFHPSAVAEGNIAVDDDLTTPVFSPYSGRVVKLMVKLGDPVEQGTPLAAVEATEIVQTQNDVITAVANLKTARAQLTMAQTTEQRQHELYNAKGGALKDWQQSQTDRAAAQNNVRSGEVALAAARNRFRILGKSEAELRAVETAPNGAIDPVAIVRAPIAGVVTQRQVGLGQNIESVTAGAANPIFTIGNLSTVWMVADLREADVPRVKLGQPVEVSVDALPDRVFNAKLSWIGPGIDANTHRLAVRAEVENPDGVLKPQMFARFRILTGAATAAPAVPDSAIVYDGDAARAWVAEPDGGLKMHELRLGQVSGHAVEVLSGIAAGDTVVTAGALFIDRAAKGD